MVEKQFTIEELHELEELQIMGGKGPDGTNAYEQCECTNKAAGCGAGVAQYKCDNSVTGCGSIVHYGCAGDQSSCM